MVNCARAGRAAPLACLAAAMALAGGAPARAQPCALVVPFPTPAAGADLPPPAPDAPRIRSLRFSGQRALGAATLRGRMAMKPSRFWRGSRASVYSDQAWAQDHGRLCDLYREAGYVAAAVGPPQVVPAGTRDGRAQVALVIPVREGPRHGTGRVELQGVTWPDADAPAPGFRLRPGQAYGHGRVREELERLRRAAGRRGHATWSARITLTPRPGPAAAPLVDVAVQVDEGPPWFVGRIAFRGARVTRDVALRRAVVLDEGALLDTDALEESGRRLDALGFVRVRDVEVVPAAADRPVADVAFVIEERPAFRYGLSGGVNALEGFSVAAELGAVNAVGRGERGFASVQLGEDVRSYELSLALPHILGSGWTAGLQVRAQRLDLEGVPQGGLPPHTREEGGLSLFAHRPLARRVRLGVAYSLTDVTLAAKAGPPPPGFGERRDGRLALSLAYDGWDHGWKPRQGLRVDGQVRGWGGPLGGSADALEVRGRAFALAPLGGRAVLGGGVRAGLIASRVADGRLPFDERYLLGGEDQLRGFDARSVGPLDAAGALVAGTRFVVLQAEAHGDVGRGLRVLAFADAGQAWADTAGGRFRVSTGLELRFELPLLRVPLRLIGALNPARDPFHPPRAFRFAVGPLP